MTLVVELADNAVDRYTDTLSEVAAALAVSDVETARERLAPISGELWTGRLSFAVSAGAGAPSTTARNVSDRIRAQVFLRDGLRCTYCGGRAIPRCVLVAISDVFPESFAYDPHYGRGRIHPAFWAVAPEADHVLAHARGGAGEMDNLTTLHTTCNARKANLLVAELPVVVPAKEIPGWDGLLAEYAGTVAAGNTHGKRHSAPGYHQRWSRYFELQSLGSVFDPGLNATPLDDRLDEGLLPDELYSSTLPSAPFVDR
ncbi:HNH endonuclease [Leifsonia sp. Root112D2]|uniref:HNH endonuclease n=1 Tax=Leifsonia sp. Root112D2 TaxID=1736426 RepID=UPI0006F6B61E|nr:HNH endonuclease [Leifsonia sp. Root112D2]KQV07074.1 hypothetical protein ASC63_07010 [Leifsonia sp. Root112D2]